MNRPRPVLLVTVLAGAAALLLLGALGVGLLRGVGKAPEGRINAAVSRAPQFTLTQLDGQAFDFAERNRQQPVFIYFWASWCVPCQAEAPIIESLWKEYRDRGVVFVGVNIWERPQDGREFAKQYRLSFPVVADETGSVYIEYGVQGLPTAFFVAAGGSVRTQFSGPLDERTLRGLLDEIAPAGRS